MLRTILILIAGSGYTILTLPFAILWAILTRNPSSLYSCARLGFRLALKMAGVRIQVEGRTLEDPTKTYLFVANHQSYCDPAALFLVLPHHDLRFMIKKELWKLPLVNLGMWLAGYVFVDRRNGFKARQSMRLAVERLKAGQSFLVFAEGTRTRTGKLGSFKRGSFQLAVESGVPILPITISGSYQILRPRQFKICPGMIKVVLHPPLETQELEENSLKELAEKVRVIIASALPKATGATVITSYEVDA
jgi:1-acyl-sn-glycerol-3-phosphate acyltransferase